MLSQSALVTGAYGFVGRHVARHMARNGYVVRGMGHGAWGRGEWREWGLSDWHSADVNVETLLTHGGEPDVIVHCAGSGSVAFSMTHPYQDHQRSVTTTLAVMDFARQHRPEARIVLPSSAGVYGVAAEQPIRVNSTLAPVSPYGLHKRMAEDLCVSYARHFGVRAAVVRLFSVYGIGIRKQLLWDACSKLSAGDLMFGGTGDETRDWIHIEDAAQLLLRVSEEASQHCPIVNGGSGAAITIREVVNTVAKGLGLVDFPQFSGRSRPGDPVHYLADISEAKALGWTPARDWQTEVSAYVEWFKNGSP
ncbi:NAD-dependent epimerase/dehydratase family protein [soil metagenome]